jgi:hypothetical protein
MEIADFAKIEAFSLNLIANKAILRRKPRRLHNAEAFMLILIGKYRFAVVTTFEEQLLALAA